MPVARGRVEVDEEKLVRYSGGKVAGRFPIRDLEDVDVALLAKTLTFKGGRKVRLYDLWSNTDRVVAILRKAVDNKTRKEREEGIRRGNARRSVA